MCKVLPIVPLMILFLAACGNRTTSLPGNDQLPGKDSLAVEVAIQQDPPHDQTSTDQTSTDQESSDEGDSQPELDPQPAITMSPAHTTPTEIGPQPENLPLDSFPSIPATRAPTARTPAARAPTVQAARSLAGHDRFLVSRPFGGVRPADFELGLVFNRKIEPSLWPLLDSLGQALMGKDLKTAGFSSQGLLLAELLYNQELSSAPGIMRIRFSEARRMPGTAYAVAIRLFSEAGFAEGLAILGTGIDGNWLIEHIDLELENLGEKASRREPYDPYGYSRNLLD